MILELVRKYFPFATDHQAKDVLWGCTGWPGFFRVPDKGPSQLLTEQQKVMLALESQLKEISQKAKCDPKMACYIADQEISEALKRGKEEEIRLSAYFLWEKSTNGNPVNEEETADFWLKAEQKYNDYNY